MGIPTFFAHFFRTQKITKIVLMDRPKLRNTYGIFLKPTFYAKNLFYAYFWDKKVFRVQNAVFGVKKVLT